MQVVELLAAAAHGRGFGVSIVAAKRARGYHRVNRSRHRPKEPSMFRITAIDHIVLRVVDLDAMLHFYLNVLGCTVERRQDDIGLVQLRAGASLIDLVPVDGVLGRAGGAAPAREGRNLDHFCLGVDPFDEATLRSHLRAAGIEAGPVQPRNGAQGLGPSMYLQDPQGNTVELKGPPFAPRPVSP